MIIREMHSDDVASAHRIRLSVRENQLSDPSGVTEQDYHDFMARDTKIWVCMPNGTIVGFAMVDVEKRNLWALFVAPEHAFRGVGRASHDTMLAWYFTRPDVLRLSSAPNTRAEQFYRRAGCASKGRTPSGEVIFELQEPGT